MPIFNISAYLLFTANRLAHLDPPKTTAQLGAKQMTLRLAKQLMVSTKLTPYASPCFCYPYGQTIYIPSLQIYRISIWIYQILLT